jgi:hypothetical protein
MIDYRKIQDAIDREADLAYGIGYPSMNFEHAIGELQDGIDYGYTEDEWFEVIREVRNNYFGRLKGEEKSILDNLLTRVLDIVSFG